MLEVYKTSADNNIYLAEKMLTDAMAVREAANEALDRAAAIAEALARFLDTGTLAIEHGEEDESVPWP